jgi:acyl carrier protein
MERNELAEQLRQMVAEVTELPLDSLVLDAPLESLGIDSLDVVKLAARFERVFGITITTDELLRVKTLADIVDGIGQKTTP